MMLMWIFLAGGLGMSARYLIGQWAAAAFGVSFPYGTVIVNLAGCFALGLVVQLAIAGTWPGECARRSPPDFSAALRRIRVSIRKR